MCLYIIIKRVLWYMNGREIVVVNINIYMYIKIYIWIYLYSYKIIGYISNLF